MHCSGGVGAEEKLGGIRALYLLPGMFGMAFLINRRV